FYFFLALRMEFGMRRPRHWLRQRLESRFRRSLFQIAPRWQSHRLLFVLAALLRRRSDGHRLPRKVQLHLRRSLSRDQRRPPHLLSLFIESPDRGRPPPPRSG